MEPNPFQAILNDRRLLEALQAARLALKPNPISFFDNFKDNTASTLELAYNLYIGTVRLNDEPKVLPRTLFFVDRNKPEDIYEQWPVRVLSPFFLNSKLMEREADIDFWCIRIIATKTLCHLSNRIIWVPIIPSLTVTCFDTLLKANDHASALLNNASPSKGGDQTDKEVTSNGVSKADKTLFMANVDKKDLTSSESQRVFTLWANSELKELLDVQQDEFDATGPQGHELADLATICVLYWLFGPKSVTDLASFVQIVTDYSLNEIHDSISSKLKEEPYRRGYAIALLNLTQVLEDWRTKI